METTDLRDAADALLGAYRSGIPIPPLSGAHPEATLADAYRIQQEQVRTWIEAGEIVRGHKIGLVSAAMQAQMGVHQPDYGHLTASMFHAEHTPIPTRSFIQPRIEPEIAFVLRAPLRGPGLTVADVARAVDSVLPALEIVDSRIQDWKITIVDTIADNASSGAVILGTSPTPLVDVDLGRARCRLDLNGDLVRTGTSTTVLGTPLDALTWLANRIGSEGVGMEPGHVVLSGSLTETIPIVPGDRVTADITGIGGVTAVLARDQQR